MGRVYIRRVQRLGTASLVVTLPKEWVRKVGLKQGDVVFVEVDGDVVKVYTSGGPAAWKLELEEGERGSDMVYCAFDMGASTLELRGAGVEAALEARSAASRLPWVDVSSGPGFVEVRVVLDDSRVSPWELLGGLARLSVDLVGLIEKLSREPTPQLVQLAREAHNEIVKYEHLAVRLLSSPGPEQPLVYAAAALGNAAADLWSLASMLATRAETGLDTSLSQETLSLLKETRGVLEWLSRLAAEKRLERREAARLLRNAELLHAKIKAAVIRSDGGVTAAANAYLEAAAREVFEAVRAVHCAAVRAEASK